jgi:hypothetical protein
VENYILPNVNNIIPYITRFGFTQFKWFYTKSSTFGGMYTSMTNFPSTSSKTYLLTRHTLGYIHSWIWHLGDAAWVFVHTNFWNRMWPHHDYCHWNETWVEGETSSHWTGPKIWMFPEFFSRKNSSCYPVSGEVLVMDRMPATSLFHFCSSPSSDG